MKIFTDFVDLVAALPDAVSLLAAPLVAIVLAAILLPLRRRSLFFKLSVLVGAIGFFLVCCKGELFVAFGYLSLYAAEISVIALLPARSPKKKKDKKSKADEMFEKFYVPLEKETEETQIPKVNCFPDDEEFSDGGALQLSHAESLLEKLKTAKLTPTDRLEAEAISRRLGVLKSKRLTRSELDELNDCLSSVLKLTAKYN